MHKTICFHCKKLTGNTGVKIVKMKNGQRRMKSKCTTCGGKKSTFVAASCQ